MEFPVVLNISRLFGQEVNTCAGRRGPWVRDFSFSISSWLLRDSRIEHSWEPAAESSMSACNNCANNALRPSPRASRYSFNLTSSQAFQSCISLCAWSMSGTGWPPGASRPRFRPLRWVQALSLTFARQWLRCAPAFAVAEDPPVVVSRISSTYYLY